jgi:hypothetical protein
MQTAVRLQMEQQAVIPTDSGKFMRTQDVWAPESGKGWSLTGIFSGIAGVHFVESKAWRALSNSLEGFSIQVLISVTHMYILPCALHA